MRIACRKTFSKGCPVKRRAIMRLSELLIVVCLITIIAAVTIPKLRNFRTTADAGFSSIASEVSKDIFDDGRDDAYIRVDKKVARCHHEAAIIDIMTKQQDWEQQFPNKRIVAMLIVNNDCGRPDILLIHYEIVLGRR